MPAVANTERVDRPTGRRRLWELLAEEMRLVENFGHHVTARNVLAMLPTGNGGE